jgi:hypothetical protein
LNPPADVSGRGLLFGISLFQKQNINAILTLVSFQFFSPDGAFLVKTIKKDEVLTLLQMLPKYCVFMKDNGRQTLLTRFCGMYDVCFGDECYTLVVMNAVFPASASRKIAERFDLKGSTVGRECSEEEKITKGRGAVLKDLDLLKEVENAKVNSENKSGIFSVGPASKECILGQLQRDVSLLMNCSVIDYSLLVGIEPCGNSRSKRSEGSNNLWKAIAARVHGPTSVDGGKLATMTGERNGCPVVYYFGLIDFLQPFNVQKSLEWRVKSLVNEKETFSCVPPDVYAKRLLEFLDSHIA